MPELPQLFAAALGAAFRDALFTALDVAAAAWRGDAGLHDALYATCMRTYSASFIGRRLAIIVRECQLKLESWRSGLHYYVAADPTSQDRAGPTAAGESSNGTS